MSKNRHKEVATKNLLSLLVNSFSRMMFTAFAGLLQTGGIQYREQVQEQVQYIEEEQVIEEQDGSDSLNEGLYLLQEIWRRHIKSHQVKLLYYMKNKMKLTRRVVTIIQNVSQAFLYFHSKYTKKQNRTMIDTMKNQSKHLMILMDIADITHQAYINHQVRMCQEAFAILKQIRPKASYPISAPMAKSIPMSTSRSEFKQLIPKAILISPLQAKASLQTQTNRLVRQFNGLVRKTLLRTFNFLFNSPATMISTYASAAQALQNRHPGILLNILSRKQQGLKSEVFSLIKTAAVQRHLTRQRNASQLFFTLQRKYECTLKEWFRKRVHVQVITKQTIKYLPSVVVNKNKDAKQKEQKYASCLQPLVLSKFGLPKSHVTRFLTVQITSFSKHNYRSNQNESFIDITETQKRESHEMEPLQQVCTMSYQKISKQSFELPTHITANSATAIIMGSPCSSPNINNLITYRTPQPQIIRHNSEQTFRQQKRMLSKTYSVQQISPKAKHSSRNQTKQTFFTHNQTPFQPSQDTHMLMPSIKMQSNFHQPPNISMQSNFLPLQNINMQSNFLQPPNISMRLNSPSRPRIDNNTATRGNFLNQGFVPIPQMTQAMARNNFDMGRNNFNLIRNSNEGGMNSRHGIQMGRNSFQFNRNAYEIGRNLFQRNKPQGRFDMGLNGFDLGINLSRNSFGGGVQMIPIGYGALGRMGIHQTMMARERLSPDRRIIEVGEGRLKSPSYRRR